MTMETLETNESVTFFFDNGFINLVSTSPSTRALARVRILGDMCIMYCLIL
jgi:hypothetical protein